MANGGKTPKRILITGAAGFVGRHFIAELARVWPNAVVCPTGETPAAGMAQLDVTDAAADAAALSAFRPDAIVHLAAVAAVQEAGKEAERAWRVNFEGTRRLARAGLRHVPEAWFLFVSSAACYGRSFRSGRAVAEGSPLEPLDTYSATKAATEMALSAMVPEGLKLVRLRPFTHIGPGQSEAFAIASFARQIARIEAGLQAPEVRVGPLVTKRDFLDVRDVCSAYVRCLECTEALEPGIAINLASGVARRVGDVLDALLAEARATIAVRSDEARFRTADLEITCGDPSLAARLLGWRPEIPWAATLADILADSRSRVRNSQVRG